MSVDVLIAGAEQGHFTLPPELIAAARAVAPLQAVLDEQPHAPQMVAEAKAKFQADLLEAARLGKTLPSGAELAKTSMAAAAQAEVADVLREALRQSERHLARTFSQSQGTILVDHLQPALEETIASARKAKPSELPALLPRYEGIRACRSALHRIPAPQRDVHGVFAEFKDLDQWWPEFYPERSKAQLQRGIQRTVRELQERGSDPAATFTPAPWPADPLERFKWILENAEPWLPDAEQQDARFDVLLERSNVELAEGRKQWREQHLAIS
jgi:hypothetical protein